MKVVEALNLKNLLDGNSKTEKMGMSKVTLVMMLVKLGKVQKEFESVRDEVIKRLKVDYEGFDERLEKAHEYERLKDNGEPEWNEEQYAEFMNGDYKKLLDAINIALQPELGKEADVDFRKFDEQGFGEWMESNNIDAGKAAFLAQYLLDI